MLPIHRRALAAVFCTICASAAVATDFGRTPGEFGVTAGSANYTVPIWAPPGPVGVQPSIAVTYNSQSGNGTGGVGWKISGVASIYRCTRTPHQDGNAQAIDLTIGDRFCLNGNRLRLASGTYGVASSVYYTELANYSRITAYGGAGNGPAYFVVEAKSGLKYEFGSTTSSRVLLGTTAVKWMLNKVYDRAGNNYIVTYSTATGSAVPASIFWTPTSLGASTYRYEMEFMYYTTRPNVDSTTGEVAGNIVTNTNRIESIRVKSAGTVVRKYRFAYGTSTVTSRSLLTSAKECADDAETNCFLPTTFTYQTGQAGLTAGAGAPPAGSSNSIYRGHYDFNGDGKNDIAYLNGTTWYVALSTNSGFSAAYNTGVTSTDIAVDQFLPTGRAAIAVIVGSNLWIYRWDDATSAFVGNNTGVATGLGVALDYNGDRLTDFVYLGTAGTLRVRPNTSTGSGNPTFASSTTTTAQLPTGWSYTLIDPYLNNGLYHADVNGDGRGDLYAEAVFTDRTNPDNTVVNSMILTGLGSGVGLPPMNTWGPEGANWNLVNFNDDACSDRISGQTIQIAACNGSYASTITLPAVPSLLLDWDGDGRTDILVDNGGTFGVYKSQGSTFGSLITTSLPSSGTFFDTDLDGDGLDDLVKVNGTAAIGYWTHTAGGAAPTYATNVPDLLSSVTDGFGVTNSVSYVSTAWSQYDKGATTSYPLQEAPPQIVVAKSTNTNGIGGTFDQTYFYVGARLHAQRRQSAGFQRLDETDSRNSLVSRLYFEQSFPVSGMLSQQELMQPNGTTTISRIVNVNTPSPLDLTINNQRYFVYPSSSTSTNYEVGGPTYNGSLIRTVTTANLFDNSSGTLYDQTVTTTEPASGANGVTPGGNWVARSYIPTLLTSQASLDNWCIGRPARIQQINSNNLAYPTTITRTTDMTWDAVLCRPTQAVAEPGNGTLQVTADIAYDGFGNVNQTTVTGAAGMPPRVTKATYSDATYTSGQFPISTEDAESIANTRNQKTVFTWNQDLGLPLTATNPNGLPQIWVYDAFGRRTKETQIDGTATTWAYSNCTAITGGCLGTQNRMAVTSSDLTSVGSVVKDTLFYLDQFDRVIVSKDKLLSGAYNRIDREFDALGRLQRESAPCLWTSCTNYWITNSYDLIDRPTTISRPISDSDPTAQSTLIFYEGLTTRVRDAKLKDSLKVVNALGQLAKSADPDGYFQTFDYDAFGDVMRVQDPSSVQPTLQSSMYNVRGMLTQRTDMDMGTWIFTPNALGETVGQTDAKGQSTTFVFDRLGRLISRTEPEGTSTWTLGTSSAAHNIGLLESLTGPGYSESYTYTALSQVVSRLISAGGSTYQYNFAYNSQGKLDHLTYPTSTSGPRLSVKFDYQNGALYQLRDFNALTTVFWTANDANARNQIIQETLGNGLQTRRAYDAVTGWLKTIKTGVGSGTAVQDLAYTWDLVGNLLTRKDVNQSNLTESFVYDNLYRLQSSSLSTTTGNNLTMAYDLLGNITSKSDVGTYTYHATKKHQVISTSNGWSFGYDNNGNMTSGRGASYTWTSFNYPACIYTGATCGSASMPYAQFSYTPNRQYWKQDAYFPASGSSPAGTVTTIYAGGLLEKVTTSGGTDYRHLIPAGSTTVVVSRQTNNVNNVYYVGSDQLGSLTTFTGTSLSQPVQTSFDAFGRRRDRDWSGGPNSADMTSIAGITRRGYTGHTMLDNFELIHMNGRVQDPLLGKFVSADPFISEPLNTQGYNRYSYVQNNPLSMIDPSGFNCQNGEGGGLANFGPFDRSYCGRDWQPPGDSGGTDTTHGRGSPGEGPSDSENPPTTALTENQSGAQQFRDFLCSVGFDFCTIREETSAQRDWREYREQTWRLWFDEKYQAEWCSQPDHICMPLVGRGASTPSMARPMAPRAPTFFRGARAGETPSLVPRANEFKVDPATGFVKDTHGVSVFDNAAKVSSKGLVPHQVNPNTIPDSLRIIQRGNDPNHFEIVPIPGANLMPQQYINACSVVRCF